MSLLGITNDDISMKHHSVSAVLALRAELPGFKCNFLKKKKSVTGQHCQRAVSLQFISAAHFTQGLFDFFRSSVQEFHIQEFKNCLEVDQQLKDKIGMFLCVCVFFTVMSLLMLFPVMHLKLKHRSPAGCKQCEMICCSPALK